MEIEETNIEIEFNTQFSLGGKVRDKLTGFEGRIVAIYIEWPGNAQYLVQPKALPNDMPESQWLNKERLKTTS